MKITILTQYFPPEVGAPQNRLYELAVRLKKKGAEVTILTAMPNYPKMEIHESYKGKWYCKEEMDGMQVHRAWIFVSKSKGIFKRLLNYYSFVFSSFWIGLFKLKRQDIILVESPPLFLGKTAFILKLFKRSKLIFNVSDLWPESAEKLGLVSNRFFLWLSYRLEAFLYKRSWLVTGQTQGIVKSINQRFPKVSTFWLPNGVDVNYFQPKDNTATNWRIKNGFSESDFIILYAGIIGHAQGLEIILHASKNFIEQQHLKFVLLGSGPEKEKLLLLAKDMNLFNVKFLDPVPKSEMPEIVQSINCSIIPLRKLDLFKGAIPSKIFELLAMQKPILLGVDGEAKELFINEGNAGLYFEPENSDDLSRQIQHLLANEQLAEQLGKNGRNYVIEKFERDKIANAFWDFIQLKK